ncbi:unnamed protein product [Hermetia illucens]|uniref:Fatty acyl-CoA reductase n=1 Tax=Hermetia illucens TaxID=343691 RepID=A0A7R8UEL3_HERIL|nr:putative fatty acyl-CoA reductase CG5065 [Hermetia illucens]CAD7078547.1 unnamed protein product [Hermetia illucens]
MKLTIPEFYRGREIFVTGGSGFLGKVLIEKLLRSCPDLNTIFVLLRSKKGRSADERLSDIVQLPLFDVLRETMPTQLSKLVAIAGDVTELKMGISTEGRELMRNVSVIFHAAASVRFDDPLRDAILINTRGTREVMRFAETLPDLKALIHVSTTYCNPDKHVVEEKLYPPYADWRTAITIAEKFDKELLNILEKKFSSFQPNTYTFTKSMAEHVVNDYKDKLPVLICRPSIVVSTIAEPIPGWIDNFNGPVGMLVASGVGVLRTVYGNPDVISDFMPVDVAIKSIIIAGYEKGMQTEKSKELTIYNCSTSNLRGVTTGEIIEIAKELIKLKPMEQMIWVPYGSLTSSKTLHYIRFFFLHLLVAILVDSILRVLNRKVFLLKIHRRIYEANLALHYFASTHWEFINNKFVELDAKVPSADVREFSFLYLKDLDIKDYFYKALVGARKFLLKESDDNIEYARRKFWTIYYIDKVLRIIVGVCLIRSVFRTLGVWNYIGPYLQK